MTTELRSKIKTLGEAVWERRALGPILDAWLKNYRELSGSMDYEREHALFLLSNFLYFGAREMRELLKALYRFYEGPVLIQPPSPRYVRSSRLATRATTTWRSSSSTV